MNRKKNGLSFVLISFLLLAVFVCATQDIVYGQCPDGKILVKKTNPNGKEHFICVSSNAANGMLNGNGPALIWVDLDMTQNYYTETGEVFEGFGIFVSWEYDDLGRRTVAKIDSGIDGIIDSITYWEYDENGNNVIVEHDYGADGTIDRIRYFYYDEDGNQTAAETDRDANGIIDEGQYREYDGDGNVILERDDNNGDGTFDSARFYDYFDGKNERQILIETDTDYDGSIDNSDRTFEYYSKKGNKKGKKGNRKGKKGNLLREEFDYGDDGTIELITRNTYTDDNNILQIDHEYTEYADPPGLYISSVTYQYDEYGNVIQEQIFWSDGVLQERIYNPVLLQEALN